jgi:hypothetical protein
MVVIVSETAANQPGSAALAGTYRFLQLGELNDPGYTGIRDDTPSGGLTLRAYPRVEFTQNNTVLF